MFLAIVYAKIGIFYERIKWGVKNVGGVIYFLPDKHGKRVGMVRKQVCEPLSGVFIRI